MKSQINPERGRLINAEATAAARVVEAVERFHRTPQTRASDYEKARVRLLQAREELARAKAALMQVGR